MGARPTPACDSRLDSMRTGLNRMCPTIAPSRSATRDSETRPCARSASTRSASVARPNASWLTRRIAAASPGRSGRTVTGALGVDVVTPVKPEAQDLLKQALVGESGLLRRLRQLLAVRDLGIGVRLQGEDPLVGVQPEVDARIPAEAERAVDALGEVLDATDDRIGQPARLTPLDPVLLLVGPAPL